MLFLLFYYFLTIHDIYAFGQIVKIVRYANSTKRVDALLSCSCCSSQSVDACCVLNDNNLACYFFSV